MAILSLTHLHSLTTLVAVVGEGVGPLPLRRGCGVGTGQCPCCRWVSASPWEAHGGQRSKYIWYFINISCSVCSILVRPNVTRTYLNTSVSFTTTIIIHHTSPELLACSLADDGVHVLFDHLILYQHPQVPGTRHRRESQHQKEKRSPRGPRA